MTLLFDQNISQKSLSNLDDVYPGSQHVMGCNLQGSDTELLEYAHKNAHILVTTDPEFIDQAIIAGVPTKILLVKGLNINTNKVEWSLRIHEHTISQFANQADSPRYLIINE